MTWVLCKKAIAGRYLHDAPPAEEVPESLPATASGPSDSPIWQQWLDLLLPGPVR